jgi:hypothetical protein
MYEGVKRYNEMRLYYAIRSKIIFHRDLDDSFQRITFYISIPIYLIYYINIALRIKNKKRNLKAIFEGLIDSFINSDEIKYIR